MAVTYKCNFAKCLKVFKKAYDLRKHKAAHNDPNSVFHCPHCDFITFTKTHLATHFVRHTREKVHQCPDVVVSAGAPTSRKRCVFKTHDPAALTRHRQKVHGYKPPPNRHRATRTTACDTQPSERSRHPGLALPRNLSYVSLVADDGPGDACISVDALPLSEVASLPNVDYYYDPQEGMHTDPLYDPTLRAQWMADYEASYSFQQTGGKSRQEPVHDGPSPITASILMTGREGCLCPEWMVEAGIEGWDQSALESPRECYVLDA